MGADKSNTTKSARPQPKGISEADFQRQVTDLCDWLGLMWHHETDSRKSKAGFPDLVICGPGGIVFFELKTQRGRVSSAQHQWIEALQRAGQKAYVARPGNLAGIKRLLTELAKAPE